MNTNPVRPMPQVHGLSIGSVYLMSDIAKAFGVGSKAVKRLIPEENRRTIGGRCYALFDLIAWEGITRDPSRDAHTGFDQMKIDPIPELFGPECPKVVIEREAARLLGVGSCKRIQALVNANRIEAAPIRGALWVCCHSLREYAKSRGFPTTGKPEDVAAIPADDLAELTGATAEQVEGCEVTA